MNELLTVTQAASRLGVSLSAVQNAMHAGRLPFTALYGKRLVSSADVEAYRTRTQPEGSKRVGRPPKDIRSNAQAAA